MTTKAQYEQARLAGQSARSAGRGRDSGPVYALGAEGAMFREAWRSGWEDRDQEIKERKK